jgi:predicted DNA-binding transcriptional regulator AlpA
MMMTVELRTFWRTRMTDRIVTDAKEVKSLTGLSKRVLATRARENRKFPQPVALGYRTDGRISMLGWRMSALQRLIRQLPRA